MPDPTSRIGHPHLGPALLQMQGDAETRDLNAISQHLRECVRHDLQQAKKEFFADIAKYVLEAQTSNAATMAELAKASAAYATSISTTIDLLRDEQRRLGALEYATAAIRDYQEETKREIESVRGEVLANILALKLVIDDKSLLVDKRLAALEQRKPLQSLWREIVGWFKKK